uniref:EstA2 n=1 Tax=uncultured organism TaxID=155900 RepID=A0A0G3VV00_9ZZZZ|nr:EstA2 [uncultured organism]
MVQSKKIKILLNYPDETPAGYSIYDGIFSKVYDEKGELLFEVNGLFPPRITTRNYSWIEKILNSGLSDGRKRFILYVASRYLVNVKKVDEEEALKDLRDFYYKNGSGRIYDAWLRSVIRGVQEKKLLPPSLKNIQDRDKELYEEITKILEKR